jgi:hypothetical protein
MANPGLLSLYSGQQSVFEPHAYPTPAPYQLPHPMLMLAQLWDKAKAKLIN